MAYYATINARGFLNTVEIAKFETKAERDDFVNENEHKNAKPVTRREAELAFANCYLSVGREVPKGGLFGVNKYGDTNFYQHDN